MNHSHSTKSCVLILLVALLCTERAQGLKCYNCLGIPLEASCSSIMTCPYYNAFCVTLVEELTVGLQKIKLKNKLCSPICPTNLENFEMLGTVVNTTSSCCKEDLCNAAVPTGGSTWTMAGVLLLNLGSVLLHTSL